VWKDPANAAVTDRADVATVSLHPTVAVMGARQWGIDSSGNVADLDLGYAGQPLGVRVGPGATVFVEFALLPTSLLAWLQRYYPAASDYAALAKTDTDGDGQTAEQEYAAGTNPTDGASVLRILGFKRTPGGVSTLQWSGVTDRRYDVEAVQGGQQLWAPEAVGCPGDPSGTNTLVLNHDATNRALYRIRTVLPIEAGSDHSKSLWPGALGPETER
jgi:hypothetical protein